MKRFLMALALGAATLTCGSATAHGAAKAQYGGIVQLVDDMSFELVVRGDAAELYLGDHGEKVPTANMTGKLTVLSGNNKSEAKLEPAGGHKLEAKGVKIAKGDKVIALMTSADKKTTSVRFVIK
jgi:hypothetical protein